MRKTARTYKHPHRAAESGEEQHTNDKGQWKNASSADRIEECKQNECIVWLWKGLSNPSDGHKYRWNDKYDFSTVAENENRERKKHNKEETCQGPSHDKILTENRMLSFNFPFFSYFFYFRRASHC